MEHTFLSVLSLCSCILIVTPLSQQQVGSITNYIEENIFKGEKEQYAYFVRFTGEECNTDLQSKDLEEILKNDTSADVSAIVDKKEIYMGYRMVAASYKKEKKYDVHAESRLLNPLPGSTESPISTLLKNRPESDCVVFFSLNSPCVQTCTDPKGKYSIITRLEKVNLPFYKNRAFAYTKVFEKDKEKDVWKNWEKLDKVMTLYRCRENNCIQCFNGSAKDEQCYKD